jgi:hypothetical protein
MKNSRKYLNKQMAFGLTLAVLVLFAQSKAQAQSSVQSSPNSATRASETSERRQPACIECEARTEVQLREEHIINACAATADELLKTRLLADALERENKLLIARLETEKQRGALQE